MIELVITICLLEEPFRCKNDHLTGFDQSLFSCMVSSQPVVAKYMETKPRWFAKKWQCLPTGQQANI
jgi:hypothetical protein